MSIIASHVAMLVSLYIVLALIGLVIVVKLVIDLRTKLNLVPMTEAITRPLLLDILPLILLSWLTAVDGTHILMRIWYFVAAALIALRALVELWRLLRKLV